MSEFVHSEIELAWAAGFFDGEGCFKGARTNGISDTKYGRVSISQKDPEVLYRFKSAVGGLGSVNGPYGKNGDSHCPMWYYAAAGKSQVVTICNLLRPYLSSIKIKDMDNMLSTMDSIKAYRPRLTNKDVIDIRNEYETSAMTMQEIGERYNRSSGSISDIINRRRWSHVV